MLQAPTGFGKTLTAAHIIKAALDKGRRVIFTVPALSLIDQTVGAFEAEGLCGVGVVQGYHPRTDPSQPVQVASVQTLARRQKPAADLVLVDEAHLAFTTVFDWMAEPDWSHVPFIGLSATPWTKGLGRAGRYDDLIIASTTADLINNGYLSRFLVYAPSVPHLTGIKTVAGDYHEGQLADALNKVQLVGDVVDTWMQRAENRPTLVYGVDRAHAKHLEERFLEAGIAAEYVDAFTDREDRERIFRRFRAGKTRVMCNVATLTVGLDLDVRCIVDARPTKSEMRFVQTIGRGLRPAEGKDHLLILDHAGNHLRLGLVTDVHHDSLDDGEPRAKDADREREERLPRRCEECSAIVPHGANACPQCGAVRHAQSSIDTVDGNLVELGSGKSSRAAPTVQQRAQFFAELKGLAAEKGFRPGWAFYKYKEKFGVFPDDPYIKWISPEPASLKTLNWVKSRQIAYAKARRNG